MTRIIRTKSHEEWLEHRGFGIGSSEVATILGVNPYETPRQLWLRKKGLVPPKEETFAMRAGHYLEDAVAKFWSDATGKTIIKNSAEEIIFVSDKSDIFRASPDRLFWVEDGSRKESNKGILECKTTQKSIDENDIPKMWFCQLQWLMGCSGKKYGSLAWLTAGREFGYKDFEFNETFYEWMCNKVKEWWEKYIDGDDEPPLINAADVNDKFPVHEEGKQKEVSENIDKVYEDLKKTREQISILQELKTKGEDLIKVYMEDAEALTKDGEVLITFKANKSGKRVFLFK